MSATKNSTQSDDLDCDFDTEDDVDEDDTDVDCDGRLPNEGGFLLWLSLTGNWENVGIEEDGEDVKEVLDSAARNPDQSGNWRPSPRVTGGTARHRELSSCSRKQSDLT